MKSFLPAFVAAVIAAALTAGALELVREDTPARATTSAAQPAFEPAGPAIDRASDRSSPLRPTSLDDPLELDRIAALELRIEELERRLAADGRRVVETADDAVASLADPEARAMILSVLAEEEARREEEREARRAERELDQLTRRAERIATELGLSQKDQGQLLEVMIMENEQRDAFFQDMRDAGGFGNETRNVMREELAAIREWKNGELSQRLGAQAAQQIAEMDQPRFGRDRGDRGGTDRRNRGGGGF